MKLISIILPTFNRGDYYLKKAILSVVNQTYKNWELIIIDNFSKDNTVEVVERFDDKRIKFFQINNCGIIAKSRNYGIKKSSGDYIAFLDSDDYWHKDKLKICYNILHKSDYYCICHGETWLYPNKFQATSTYGPEEKFNFINLLTKGNCVSLSAVVIHKKIIRDVGYFDESNEIVTAEDYDYWIRISKKNFKFLFINNQLGYYVIHENSESSNIFYNSKAIQNVIIKNATNRNLLKVSLSRNWINTGKSFHLKGLYLDSLKSYILSIKNDFLNFKIYFLIFLLLIPYKIFIKIYFYLRK